MSDVVLESFINFCDDMQIAEEGFGDKIKDAAKIILQKIKTLINKIVLYTKSRGGKLSIPSDIYENYQEFIVQAENLLTKFESKSISDYRNQWFELENEHNELSSKIIELNDEYDEISSKLEEMQKKYPWLKESPLWAAFRENNEYEKKENKEIINEYRGLRSNVEQNLNKYRDLKYRRSNVKYKLNKDSDVDIQYSRLNDKPGEFQKKNADYSLPNLTTVSTTEIINHLNKASKTVENVIRSNKNEGYYDRMNVANCIYKVTVLLMKCAIKPV